MIFIAVAFCILLLAFFGSSLAICRAAFLATRRHRPDPFELPRSRQFDPYRAEHRAGVERLLQEEHEAVRITSFDGLTLCGKYYPRTEGGPVAICVHGWHSAGVRDFSGGARFLLEQGWNVLLIDQRAQGDSQGRAMTFGVKERFDCLSWANWAVERCGADVEIVLYGVSMGAATVLMAAGLELPENVRCIVADSPYSSPAGIIKKVCRDRGIPPAAAWPLVYVGVRLFAGFDPNEITAADAVRRTGVPVLVIHGSDDRFVPCAMSAEIAEASPLAERQVFPGAGHGISFLADRPRYEALILDFVRRARS